MAAEDASLQGEVDEQIASVEARLAALEEQRLFSGRYDSGDALVSVNAGAGGTDAQDWAEMVLRMLMRWAEASRLCRSSYWRPARARKRVSSRPRSGPPGRTPTVCSRAERGVHRLVRLSPFDSAHRRQTSFAGVEVAPVVPDASGEIEIDEDDLQVDTYRASGAGGQHVNKTDSAVRITHRPTRRRRAVPERALAVLQPRHRDGDAARQAAGALRARTRGGDRAREGGRAGRQLRLADPLVCHCTPTRSSRTTARASRWATSSACSTATSMDSCERTC